LDAGQQQLSMGKLPGFPAQWRYDRRGAARRLGHPHDLDFRRADTRHGQERVDSGQSPGRRHCTWLNRSQRLVKRQEACRHPPPDFLTVIHIGVFTLIDAGGIVIAIPANNENRSRSR
jgi:hypothetical protein